ncbi:enoyl-CoA hydratase/isomerase family protein [Mycolicibacterium confluentis]|uniref:Putative enoyl-CoA hydratase/isomerase n=1 Tax=Mycolicibacterium confluentis TaxID=28047 RepID=A0A7I7Y545_9MYCO|nr:enoyl-CoA hydratase-related protein [Mycolicibacterium confluentis]MCV7318132.1 enoyl-CoA hydratase/isomerase family protein [Mycolicibacterium confluentis]ORV31221.1 crotonase [Mycolicibacterium confluentis]BBZ36041.1 putative enoyl-CoA hydratase/isomerase [Mycolicibacterium confluentis]
MSTAVRFDVDDLGVATLTLDGPQRLNAFSAGTADELGTAFRRCDADDDIRAVVLTGAGRAFCAGADLSVEADSFGKPGEDFSASPVQPPAWRVRKLVVAAINGHAMGVGFTLALQCDIRLVSDDAKLAIPQVRRGTIPDCQAHYTLRHAVGLATAADLLLTGRTLTGAEAAARGIATRALPADQVLPAALELARDVARNANPASVALSKRLLWSDADLDTVADEETRAHHLLMGGPDAAEGAAAWREKRAPIWRSRASEIGEPA